MISDNQSLRYFKDVGLMYRQKNTIVGQVSLHTEGLKTSANRPKVKISQAQIVLQFRLMYTETLRYNKFIALITAKKLNKRRLLKNFKNHICEKY